MCNLPLNERQKLFCEYYVSRFNATEAYMKAYPDTKRSTAGANGAKLLKDARCIDYMEQLKKEGRDAHSKAIADRKELMETLTSMIRGEASEEVALPTKFGIEKTVVKVNNRNQLAATKLLCDILGITAPSKTDVNLINAPLVQCSIKRKDAK